MHTYYEKPDEGHTLGSRFNSPCFNYKNGNIHWLCCHALEHALLPCEISLIMHFLLLNMINVPYRVNCALSPETSNGRPHVEAKLFGEESVIDLNIKGLIGP